MIVEFHYYLIKNLSYLKATNNNNNNNTKNDTKYYRSPK